MRAVHLVEEGESPSVVALMSGVDPSSVHRWRRLARRRHGLEARPVPGRPRQLSDYQLKALEALLLQGAIRHGWSNQLWTAARAAVMIRRYFGVHYHPDHVRKLLKQRLHWTSQKPQKHARECDDEEVKRWIADDWPRILRQACHRGIL